MALVDSLLTAMVRANGDALVMHVGEKPIVVAGPRTMDLSSHGLNLTAMIGMLGQLLPADAQAQLTEFGAVEHVLPSFEGNRFTVVAARSGDDIWIEIRRRREQPVIVVAPEPVAPATEPVAAAMPEPVAEVVAEPVAVEVPKPVAEPDAVEIPQPVAEITPEPVADAVSASVEAIATEAVTEPIPEPVAEVVPGAEAVPEAEVVTEPVAVSSAEALPEVVAEPMPEPAADAVAASLPAVEALAPLEAPAVAAPASGAGAIDVVGDEAPHTDAPVDDLAAATDEARVASLAGQVGEPQAEAAVALTADEVPVEAMAAQADEAPVEAMAAQVDEAPVEAMAAQVDEAPVEAIAAQPDEAPVQAIAVPVTDEAPVPAAAEAAEADAPVVAVAEQGVPAAVAHDHAEPPALVAVAADSAAAVAAAVAHVPEPVAVMAGGGGSPLHTIVSGTAMSSMDTAPHSDSVGGGALPPVSPAAPAMAQAPAEEAPGPVTRTVRIEVPTRAVKASSAERLLRLAGNQGASELFLLSQTRPSVRVEGDIRVLSEESPMRAADLEALVAEVTPEPWADAVRRGDPAEWLIEIAEVGRVRCASFRDHRGPGAIFRFTASQAASADQLALDDAARLLATEPDGLVVVAGPAGSDKAAIVGAFVDTINRQRGDYVITLEPQVRVPHDNRHALISQREVGTDAARALAAARGALRENPDVLVIEDLNSGALAGLALAAANDSRLVIVSIEAGSTADAVQKVLELVADEGRPDARAQMARAFRGAISQLLVRKLSGGRVAAREMLSGNQVTARVLTDAPIDGLAAALDASREAANVPLVASLVGYVKAGVVDVREAYRKAPDQPRVLAALKAAGVDTAPIDGLA